MQFVLCCGLYTSKLQISASLKCNISLTSSVEYRCLRILGLLTLETRFLRADVIEVFKILRGFEILDSDRFFQVIGDGARRGTVLNCSRRGIVWTWGSSSLLAWFVRSGTEWGWNCEIQILLFATIPVTTATEERSFSALRLLKTYLRATMKRNGWTV